ncbi:glycosyltransferase [Autumnicola psychrophila]|uniref:Glycosyltransferase n=1 Tax=Autumnicola psychrophila TaxID=3075592 RepID=A0ABU3DS58_9FLAO|nr:glycosyltransferase [Zunongwangia sp. F225]MDT0686553.1 glycosyltransferase [Zunongwangia sp. F225]
MDNSKFAAFIVTYERTETLLETISIIRNQSFPPHYLLIVDNSISCNTENALKKYISESFQYYKVGYNSGPAGGSKVGLRKLANLGYDWIYWGDDNNPPRDQNVFQEMFGGIRQKILTAKLGAFGGKGGTFNKWTGRVRSLDNKVLRAMDFASVDFIAGGQTLIVNAEVVRQGIVPDEKLFFSFEDLDFCLKIKAAGYALFVDSKPWLRVRMRDNYRSDNYRWKGSSFGTNFSFPREYYSTRSLLKILYKNHFYIAFLYNLLKAIAKMLLGFRFGWSYGKRIALIQFFAIKDFIFGNYGKQMDL